MCEKRDKDKHLTPEELERFNAMKLEADALIAFAEHIEACQECAQRAAEFSEQSKIRVPKGFAAQVYLRAAAEDKREFYRYSLRVCAAVCAALTLLIGGNFSYDKLDIKAPKLEFLDKITQSVSDFSNNMFSWEGLLYGQEK